MPTYRSKDYTGTVQGSDVTIETDGWQSAVISIDEGSATTGTVVISNLPPGMSVYKTFGTDGTYTVGTSQQISLIGSDIGTLKLAPSSVDAAMTYRVQCFNGSVI